eukprot:jgi/Botrbrau1/1388/Bobra.0063s0088.1
MARTAILVLLTVAVVSQCTAVQAEGLQVGRKLLQASPPPLPSFNLPPEPPPLPNPFENIPPPPPETPIPAPTDPPFFDPPPPPPPSPPPPPPPSPPPPPPVVLSPPPPPPPPPPPIPSPPPPPGACTGLLGCIVQGAYQTIITTLDFFQSLVNIKLNFWYQVCSLFFTTGCINYAPPTATPLFG